VIFMEYCKLQIGCIIIMMFIIILYIRESKRLGHSRKNSKFNILLTVGMISNIFDGLTAYTVNNIDKVGEMWNMILHMIFLISLDSIAFLLFVYMLDVTSRMPKSRYGKMILTLPYITSVVFVVANIRTLDYQIGKTTNYSMGMSVYACFAMVAVYILFSIYVFISNWSRIEGHKRWNVLTYLFIMLVVAWCQMLFPEALITSVCVTIVILGIYINQENPAVNELVLYHDEMIMGFATLVENKDGSTGSHIKRTSAYVKLIVDELVRKGHYKNILTKDYINNIHKAAPLHDIGKISIPDVILQKPGKLTDEEFAIMKTHAAKGGEIIRDTFGHLGDMNYSDVAYQVARHHHEKWNGKGYPDALAGEEIPLCARIMALADVFDAISEDRCYRPAMPMDKCFKIIEEGEGTDFDPLITDVFLDMREAIEKIHKEI